MKKRDLLHPGHASLGAISVAVFMLAVASIAGFDVVGAVQKTIHGTPGERDQAYDVVTTPSTAESVASHFDSMGYWLEIVELAGVAPRVYVAALPEDLPDIDDIDARKRLFVRIMLPLVLKENERIAANRERMVELRDRLGAGGRITVEERVWLEGIAERHKGSADDLDDLVRKIDVIPPSLVLAQTIEESGWGTSPFAIANNSMFGQRVYDPLEPGQDVDRPDPRYRLAHYGSLADSVAAYMRNINRHRAYAEFRTLRAQMRALGKAMDSLALAATLTRYSELGKRYTRKIQNLIVFNELDRLDHVQLMSSQTAQLVIPEA